MDEHREHGMNIVYVTPEVVPFSKQGGLGDVAAALPGALARAGHDVSVFSPYYRSAQKLEPHAVEVANGKVPVGSEWATWALLKSDQGKGSVTQYFIKNDKYFDRDGIYGDRQGDYPDAFSRYLFFSRAVLVATEALEKKVDVFHCNDWQTALIPVYLKLSSFPFHASAASLLTIHNLSYQGLFWHWDWPLLNLPWKHFNWKELEFHGKVNLLKGALAHADQISTVSSTYAKQILTREFGCGLEGALKQVTDRMAGVLHGVDDTVWDPASDSLLPATYSARDLSGKQQCKQDLLARFELPFNPDVPLVGMIGRLNGQKGFDLVAQILKSILAKDIQLVVLGTGEEQYHQLLRKARDENPQKLGVSFVFDHQLTHLIEAGSDLFMMPSRFEPGGSSQLYALRYGAVPLVHGVGGLADSVVDTNEKSLAAGQATGFVFEDAKSEALQATLDRALTMFRDKPGDWRKIQECGMQQDWSWDRTAREYLMLYEKAMIRKAEIPS